ncbi:MAG TPA: type II toxin-antitoxin system antitoxin SocA domain-containing protein, partial [Bacilli bacterium]|nr:type II toxin-antitoxin system antitoxin SocA domain-containing protein [Bacilli bacterium]
MTSNVLRIASALKSLYESIYGTSNDLTEMKMHKLLYFAQKTHFKNFGEWMIEEEFEGWQHGPVNTEVRQSFHHLDRYQGSLSLEEEYTLREVIHDYGGYTAGGLRNLSHLDACYKQSREGLAEDERGSQVISKETIMLDVVDPDTDFYS